MRAAVESFHRGLRDYRRLFKHTSGKGSQTCARDPLWRTPREGLCSGAVVQFAMWFCSDGARVGCVGWAGRAAGPGGLSQRQLTARGAEHAPQGSARATPPGTSPNSTRVLSILGVPPCTFAPVFCPAGVRPSGPNRGSPALAEEHRQERERFPWKPLDAQQQVADSCHVTRCINQKCCMNQVRWGQSPARSLSAALLITEPQGLLRVRGGKQLKIIKSNSDLSCRGF